MRIEITLIVMLFLFGCANVPHMNAQAERIEFIQTPIGMHLIIKDGTIRIAPGLVGGDAAEEPWNFYTLQKGDK